MWQRAYQYFPWAWHGYKYAKNLRSSFFLFVNSTSSNQFLFRSFNFFSHFFLSLFLFLSISLFFFYFFTNLPLVTSDFIIVMLKNTFDLFLSTHPLTHPLTKPCMEAGTLPKNLTVMELDKTVDWCRHENCIAGFRKHFC